MVEVTDGDKEASAELANAIGLDAQEFCANADAIVQAFATHREAAVKAERDRLLNWAANNFLAEGNYTGALVVHKLARALEQNP